MRTNKRILVVDDNPVNVQILQEMLEADYRLSCAETAEEAIKLMTKIRPAAVLLDVMLPGMDGLETCRRIRQLPGMERVAILMISAKALPSEQAAGVDAGADEYLTKPFDETELLGLLRKYVGTPREVAVWNS